MNKQKFFQTSDATITSTRAPATKELKVSKPLPISTASTAYPVLDSEAKELTADGRVSASRATATMSLSITGSRLRIRAATRASKPTARRATR